MTNHPDRDRKIALLGEVLAKGLQADERRPWLRAHNDDEWIDEIRIGLVPRFKVSPLSGSEWRTTALVELRRKGRTIKTEPFSSITTAVSWLTWGLETLGEDEDITEPIPENDVLCAQPGCPEWAGTFYRVKRLYRKDGTLEEDQSGDYYRGFCPRHSERGDSDMDDRDENHEWCAGVRPRVDTEYGPDVAPASFGGVIDLTNGSDASEGAE